MKAILEFSLPDDKEDFEMAIKAPKLHGALYEFSQSVLRAGRKYNHVYNRQLTEQESEFISFLEEKFYEILTEYEVNL